MSGGRGEILNSVLFLKVEFDLANDVKSKRIFCMVRRVENNSNKQLKH